jgi:hypothetical protein
LWCGASRRTTNLSLGREEALKGTDKFVKAQSAVAI